MPASGVVESEELTDELELDSLEELLLELEELLEELEEELEELLELELELLEELLLELEESLLEPPFPAAATTAAGGEHRNRHSRSQCDCHYLFC